MRRVRIARALAMAVGRSVLGKMPMISHLLSPICTHNSYCFHLAITAQHPAHYQLNSSGSSAGGQNARLYPNRKHCRPATMLLAPLETSGYPSLSNLNG